LKAIVHDGYGPPEDLQLRDIQRPKAGDTRVVIRVRAASVNPIDWHLMRGEPSFMKMMGGKDPTGRIPGHDVAGEVAEVGTKVTQFRPGDQVFGACSGSLAEYAGSTERRLALKPAGVTWEQAASVGIAGCTALQAVRDHGRIRRGQHVLVNGAAGGVGTFAVQIAKALGASVTGVCSTRNVDLVRSIGADHVVDYTAEDFVAKAQRYDLIVQLAGNRSVKDIRRALAPKGSLVVVGAGVGRDDTGEGGIGELVALMLRGMILSRFVRQRASMFMAGISTADLALVASLIEAGKVTPVIDRTFPLAEAADAMRLLETGHTRGKIIVNVA
jgi:NADPH:quinone reductase-like Zn-dependent oxidoreductase